jgi:hypothetical protein
MKEIDLREERCVQVAVPIGGQRLLSAASVTRAECSGDGRSDFRKCQAGSAGRGRPVLLYLTSVETQVPARQAKRMLV